jgi:hypothetical protein
MGKSKTHFEQIPVKVVKRIAQEDVDDQSGREDDGTVAIIPARKTHPAVGFRSGKKERMSKNAIN